jgi:hypothetical protein
MGLLDELTGGGQPQQDYQDFVNRYDQGAPYDGISDDEAQQRHSELAQQLSPDDYQQAAQGAFGDLPDDQRAQVGQQLADQAQSQGVQGSQVDGAAQGDPTSMGQLAGLLHEQSPGSLGQVLGGGGQAGKGALAGIVANAARQYLG